ncbi:MAG: hypothetical protein Q8Q30_01110 [Candidatus Woesebacteria bacterium]|nr:hypothetical protein [Candidatus Woesebacteria bacterium]
MNKFHLEKLPLRHLFIISLIINGVLVLSGLLAKFILPPEIPLYYGLPKNEDQLAKSIYIILPALISILITITNTVLSIISTSIYLKKTLAFASISITILSIVATYKIIFLVGSF